MPEIDLQTIDNLGRTLIDVARYYDLEIHTGGIICEVMTIIDLIRFFQTVKNANL